MNFIYTNAIIKIRLTLLTRLILALSYIIRLISNICSIDKIYYIIIALDNIMRKLRRYILLRIIINK